MAKFKYLQRLACRWGGAIKLVTQQTFDNIDTDSVSPVKCEHSVDYRNYTVYVVKGHIALPNIIHELGHVFASPHHPSSGKCNEIPWLGWEFLLAKRLGILKQWYEDYANYGLGSLWRGGFDMGDLTPSERRVMLKEAIRRSRAYGVIHQGQPVPHPYRRRS